MRHSYHSFILNYYCLASIFILTCFLSTSLYSSDQQTLLELTRKGNTTELLGFLNNLTTSKRAILETKNSNGDTPLLIAARQGNVDNVNALVSAGANINVLDAKKRDVMNIAISIKNQALAKAAISAGVDVTMVTSIYKGSALIYASAQGEAEIVNLLIAAGAPVNRINNLGWSALLEATILGDGSSRYQQIVKSLLAAGADSNIADRKGMKPIDHANAKKQAAIIQLLTKH